MKRDLRYHRGYFVICPCRALRFHLLASVLGSIRGVQKPEPGPAPICHNPELGGRGPVVLEDKGLDLELLLARSFRRHQKRAKRTLADTS